eukprot:CAMPEP_0181188386 /NCGR_PEP_ID=MMETSP1096-20121128/11085_1 /TAXON_ID=156174 ORGANISM="Chrysochromulina ericina, Strain CCMP281" /NCGR_SAMPLE_ID=MMETSP1096 /ASSEMBLY_ACC=CAM_ASM_000453 /LENGTH=61 /DNA_ID=CAMNT_0023277437 /DNA_START=405 /DNA_END=590 /DNA_ORIENTATION=-
MAASALRFPFPFPFAFFSTAPPRRLRPLSASPAPAVGSSGLLAVLFCAAQKGQARHLQNLQ